MKHGMMATILGAALMMAPMGAEAQGRVLTGETTAVGGAPHATLSGVALAVRRAGLGDIQIQSGQTATVSLLNVARGVTDIATIPTAGHALLQNGRGPYQQVGAEAGAQLAARVQALFGMQTGYFQPTVYADSGIESWEDFRGKRIFVGPPSGAAAVNQMALIEGVTGFVAGTDYEEIRMDWGAAHQAFIDGRFDVMMNAVIAPSPLVQQIAASREIRIFGIPEEIYATAEWQELVNSVGTTQAYHPMGLYERGVQFEHVIEGKGAPMMGYTFYMGVSADLPEEEAYRIVSSLIANLGEIEASAAFMPTVRIGEATVGLVSTPGLKMHPGAIRAWEEAGVTIPDSLK
ncbi:MAG: TAXI family TRAP transporter solute-binding subunit [Rhodobacteraceae bacterium]|nr:TAXI family TRAP transporter solute-binding subunit [Paracoccaceae bacterium]